MPPWNGGSGCRILTSNQVTSPLTQKGGASGGRIFLGVGEVVIFENKFFLQLLLKCLQIFRYIVNLTKFPTYFHLNCNNHCSNLYVLDSIFNFMYKYIQMMNTSNLFHTITLLLFIRYRANWNDFQLPLNIHVPLCQ